MASPLGFVLPGLALGAGAITFRPNPRGFFPFDLKGNPLQPIVAQAVIEEAHEDELEITDHPVEVGSVISDHAYLRPARVTIRCAWSNSPSPPASIVSQAAGIAASIFGNPIAILAAASPTITAAQSLLTGNSAPSQVKSVYEQLLALQRSLIPFSILTGKRQYKNMLFQSLRVDTTSRSENSLPVIAICREVILVNTQVAPLSPAVQADPSSTAAPEDQGNQFQQPAPGAVPDSGTLSGTLTDTQAGVTQLTSVVNQNMDFLKEAQGALAQMPSALQSAADSLKTVTSTLPAAVEIPLVAAAQTLSIPLGSTSLGSDAAVALAELPNALDAANAALEGAAKQIPTVELPAGMSTFADDIGSVQASIRTSLTRLDRMGIH